MAVANGLSKEEGKGLQLKSTYVIVIIPLSLSVCIRMARSTESFNRSGSVTLRKRSLSNASLALLKKNKPEKRKTISFLLLIATWIMH